MIHVIVVLAILLIGYMWDARANRKNQDKREDIICQIDQFRAAENEKLKQEIERLKTST